MTRTGSFSKTVAIFMLAGPAAPAVVIIGLVLMRSTFDPMVLAYGLLGLLIAYIHGGLQALAAGGICAALSTRLDTPGAWVTMCTFIGGVVGAGTIIVALIDPGSPVRNDWPMYAGFGAFAAFVCSLLTLQVRPRYRLAPEGKPGVM